MMSYFQRTPVYHQPFREAGGLVKLTLRLRFPRQSQRGGVHLSANPRASWDPGVCNRAVGAEERLAEGGGGRRDAPPHTPYTPRLKRGV